MFRDLEQENFRNSRLFKKKINIYWYIRQLLPEMFSFRSIPVASVVQVADTAKVGEYHLSEPIKEKFNEFISFSGDDQPEGNDVKLHGGMYYITQDIYNPAVGDLRIQFYFSGRSGDVVGWFSEFIMLKFSTLLLNEGTV